MPTQSFTHSATTSAPVEEVWLALDRPDTWEAIGGVDRVFNASVDPEGRLRGFSFATLAGGRRYIGEATPRLRDEGRLMAWDIESSEVQGVTQVELQSDGAKTTIIVTLTVESRGLLSTMFFPVIAAAVGHGLPTAVEGFASGLSR